MEERPLDDDPDYAGLTPEARRRDALLRRAGTGTRIKERMGPGSRYFNVARRVFSGAYNDGFIHAGNFAYMSLLALFPFFIALTAILAAIGEPAQRDASIVAMLSTLPPVIVKVLQPVVLEVVEARSGWLLWVGGIFGLWTSGSLVETIRDMLHRSYGTKPALAFWRYRLLSTGVIFSAVFLLLLSLFAQVLITAMQEAITAWIPGVDFILQSLLLSRLISGAMLYVSIYMLFASLTPRLYRGSEYPKWPGALAVTLWWMAIVMLLPPILRAFFNYDLTYGSLAGVMITLFFFWLVGLGMVVGTELNAALAETPEERDAVGQADNRARAARESKREENA